jgi:hypothetical protein
LAYIMREPQASETPDIQGHSMVHGAVKWGFSLPLPTATLHKLPRCSFAPLGMLYQGSIDKLAHDTSLKGPSGLSVNSRVIELFLSVRLCRFALQRIVHFIVCFRIHFPGIESSLARQTQRRPTDGHIYN